MRGYYREVVAADGAVTVEPTELMAWARSMERDSHRWQLKDELPGDVSVSTVFLGLDHSFGAGDPILYETMVFGGPLSDEQERYHTRAEAIEGHAAMVKRVNEAAHG